MEIVSKLKQYIISSRQQFIKFFIIGLSTVVLDLSFVIFLKEKVGLRPVFAVAVSQIFIIVYGFLMNKYWSFKSKQIPLKQFSRFVILAFLNYCSSIVLMYIFYDLMALNYKLIRLCTIALLSMINFVCYKHWVYKEI